MFNLFKKKAELNNSQVKKKFKVLDMHCSSCALEIDDRLEAETGVRSAKTSYAKSEVTIEYDPTKVKVTNLVEVIKKVGYQALPVE